MYRDSLKTFLCLITLVAVVVCASSASAAIVASYAGPKTFDGSSYVNLANGGFGDQGTVEFDATITNITSDTQCLWDATDSTTNLEPIIRVEDYGTKRIEFDYYHPYPSGHPVNEEWAYVDWPTDGASHHVKWTWQDGVGTEISVDDTVVSRALDAGLMSGTWTCVNNRLGRTTDDRWKCNSGTTIGNFVLSDVASFSTPEPSTIGLMVTGLVALLCYAWRKRS
jgi:hypothetical protein